MVGSIAVLLMYLKMFYWMRLFKPFAAFIMMIEQMVTKSCVFMSMLFLIWLAFANILLVLNRNRAESFVYDNGELVLDKDGNPEMCNVFDTHFESGILNAALNSYLLGLGEFSLDHLDEKDQNLLWILFIL